MSDPTTKWDDPQLREASDSTWQAGLRWLQCWWRSERLGLPPGPHSASNPDRLVGSRLAVDAPPDANFLTEQAAATATSRLADGGGGLVSEDRLRRNLLSSQPMCFNLFGHFRDEPSPLLLWLRQINPDADRVSRIEVEWAPVENRFAGGSAFDAFVEYEAGDGTVGVVGVECKYHEHLPRTDVPNVRDVYREHTANSSQWADGAEVRLDSSGLRQFWLNTLLAEIVAEDASYDHWAVAVTACDLDHSARSSYEQVKAELVDPTHIVWQPWESIVAAIDGHHEWKQLFRDRYLDFTPVEHLLGAKDRRR